MLGLEIEAIEAPGEEITGVYVGKILDIQPHPTPINWSSAKLMSGGKHRSRLSVAPKTCRAGDKVPTAIIGASLPGGFTIAPRKMRGVASQGMMCAADELGLGSDHSGLLILDESLEIGADVKPILGLDDVVMEIEVIPTGATGPR